LPVAIGESGRIPGVSGDPDRALPGHRREAARGSPGQARPWRCAVGFDL